MANKQTINGKAFEYALLTEFLEKLSLVTKVIVIENDPYRAAKGYFEGFSEKDQGTFRLYASFAVNFLIDLEPRLATGMDGSDILRLVLVSDKQGQAGDVIDVLAIMLNHHWKIGIPATTTHRELTH